MIRRTGVGGTHENPGSFAGRCIGTPWDWKCHFVSEVDEIFNCLLDGVHAKALCCEVGIWIALSEKAMLEHDRSSVRFLR